MTEENQELEIGVYDLEIGERDFGKCLYLGKRRKGYYRHFIVRRSEGKEFIFGLVFGDYSLKEGKLIIGAHSSRNQPLSSVEREYLDERLNKAGLRS